ncbi:ankyrin repeat-containing domain protein [Penicillium malachiteum]|uniref:ankyrin repeat-containing domain protein n=1 Tax=Penicillium malachiteum TaxID=1324776 RepID=UPI00254820F8|nr:ankyrin repeat-containing domain protein [Penicillium malachiteum]KAJ5725832.1 ankyrin repeat-containing domain protein [Penicillium malachiteum]
MISGLQLNGYFMKVTMSRIEITAKEGHVAIVELLLQKGAKIEVRDKTDCTPISWAVRMGHEAVVNLLIERGGQDRWRTPSRLSLRSFEYCLAIGMRC